VVAFVTLFLGLTLGPQDVALRVEGDISAVILQLDDQEVARLMGAPWVTHCDLGSDLHPHKLEAIAFDTRGEIADRALQWINLPRSRAEAAFVLEGEDPRAPTHARLVWRHIEYEQALEATIRFDGRKLPYETLDALYKAELSFGTRLGFGAEIDLTGLVIASTRSRMPPVNRLQGWFLDDGVPLRVVGLEKSPARVVMVVDDSAYPALRELAVFGNALAAPALMLLEGEQVFFVFPNYKRSVTGETTSKLFPISQAFTARDGSYASLLTRVSAPEPSGPRRVTDALAVAGVEAANGNRPRAVVLILGHEAADTSAYQVTEVLRYLAELRVPFIIWWTGHPAASTTTSENRRPLRVETPWGMADDISSITRIQEAVANLRSLIDSQLTIWVEGSHLPNRIELSKKAKRLRFAGAD
jgi:hypothetical protein